MNQASPAPSAPGPGPLLKLVLEIGPLLAFFAANSRFGIYVGTGIFMATVAVSLAVTYAMARRIPTLPLVTAVFVAVFGTLTLVLQDDLFIKLKPTAVNGLFAAILFGSLLAGRALLRPLLDTVMQMDDAGWRKLTLRWALFFAAMAVLNEAVWRNVSTDTWVAFKLFGYIPLTVGFSLLQLPLIRRHTQAPAAGNDW